LHWLPFLSTTYLGSIASQIAICIGIKMKDKLQRNYKSRSSPKLKKFFIISLIIVFIILFVYNYFKIQKINVIGAKYYTQEQIIDKIIIDPLDKNSLFLYLKFSYFEFEPIPFIQKINIVRVSNHEINLEVYEKPLIACIKYMSQYVYFDKDGIILESSSDQLEDIPFINGVDFDKFTLFEKLKVEDEEIFDVILNLSQLIQRYEIEIDSIEFDKKKEVTLIMDDISVYLGKNSIYDSQLANLSKVLPQAKEKHIKGIVDMRNYVVGEDIIIKQKNLK
jgi:cell division protein FtsQ